MRKSRNLLLGLSILVLGFFANTAFANDYKYYTIEDTGDWEEMMPEQDDGSGAYLLNLMNKKKETMLMITSVDAETEMTEDELKTASKVMIKEMQQKGMKVSKQGYDEDGEYYFAKGILMKMPFEMRILTKENILFNIISVGKNIPVGFEMIDEIEVK